MKLFVKDAFLSIAADRSDEGRLLVRARFSGDILSVFPKAHVEHTPHGAYAFRAAIDREDVVAVLAEQLRTLRHDEPLHFEGWASRGRRGGGA